jgi:excisionase family DNA binding protein
MKEQKSPWLTLSEAAEYLRCGERLLRELVINNQIPHINFAGKSLFYPARLDDWLLKQEQSLQSASGSTISEEIRGIRPDCPREQVGALLQELASYKNGCERWVKGMADNLREDLENYDFKMLSESVYAQLSRWCHPAKSSARNDWVAERAGRISMLLYDRIIDRVSHPSYRTRKNNFGKK